MKSSENGSIAVVAALVVTLTACGPSPQASARAAEKAYLQEVFQSYGIRAETRAEAERLVEEHKRKEQAAEAAMNQRRALEEQSRRFEEETRRRVAENSEELRRAEEEAERAREREIQEREQNAIAAAEAAREAEHERRQRDLERLRSRIPSGDD